MILLAALASISVRGLRLIATQTLLFLFAGIEGSAAMVRRPVGARPGALAGGRGPQVAQLGAGPAAHGG